MISREAVENMFSAMRAEGSFAVDGPLLWGFFFTDPDPSKLEAAAASLARMGYRLVDIYPAADDSDDADHNWWLHVERVEHHTVDTLDARNNELAAFASRHGLDSYDGMDVGPVGQPRA